MASISRLGTAVAQNPIAFGGTTLFLVSLSFVAVNALWYQPQVHPSAFVSTRAPLMPVKAVPPSPLPVSTDSIPVPTPAPTEMRSEVPPRIDSSLAAAEPKSTGSITPQAGDRHLQSVQQVLNNLGLYQGPVDGLTGPQTRAAIEDYRRIVGLEPGSDVDDALLRQLGLSEDAQASVRTAAVTPPVVDTNDASATVMLVQGGLRAFGHDGIQIDGVMGRDTRDAVREFQSLFGLKVTGEADRDLLAKMREIGLAE